MKKLVLYGVAILLALHAGRAIADSMHIGGVTRTYTTIVPEQKPAALVLVLHGNTQQGADMETRTSWPEVARRERFAVAFPDGLNRSWADLRAKKERIGRIPPEGTDDIAFLSALIEKLIADGVADAKRVYVTGLSNGAAMTMSLLCTRANTFAAAAAVIMNLTEGLASSCRPARPVPILFMNGTDDPLVPFNGGKGTAWYAADGFWSTAKTVQFWRDTNGCEPADASSTDLPDRDPSDGSTVTLISSTCPSGRDVLVYRINGGGHRFPGRLPDARMRRLVDNILGTQNHDIDGPEVIWAFFKRFERP